MYSEWYRSLICPSLFRVDKLTTDGYSLTRFTLGRAWFEAHKIYATIFLSVAMYVHKTWSVHSKDRDVKYFDQRLNS